MSYAQWRNSYTFSSLMYNRIKMYIKKEGENRTELAQDMVQWRTGVNTK
jgi:hypothetical protein